MKAWKSFLSQHRKRGALGEVVDHERTALIAEPNSKEFAAMMLRLINDEALRKNLSEAGRSEVEQRFSADRMVENTIRVYEDVLQKLRKDETDQTDLREQ